LRQDRHYYGGSNIRNLGKQIHRDEITISSVMNEEVITPIDLKEYLEAERIGIFQVRAYKSAQRWQSASRWVMITDLGIMAKKTEDELLVWVNSLSTLKPVRGALVTLLSRNNQKLLEGQTDSRGLVTFSSTKEVIGDFEPYLILVSYGKDLSFIELNRSESLRPISMLEDFPTCSTGMQRFYIRTVGSTDRERRRISLRL